MERPPAALIDDCDPADVHQARAAVLAENIDGAWKRHAAAKARASAARIGGRPDVAAFHDDVAMFHWLHAWHSEVSRRLELALAAGETISGYQRRTGYRPQTWTPEPRPAPGVQP